MMNQILANSLYISEASKNTARQLPQCKYNEAKKMPIMREVRN